jgi:para-nitrobenzyl esterase
MDVNCLSVNIFTPLFVTDPPTDVFHPVLVLFSGGPYGLDGGSSRRYGLHGPMSNLVAPGKMVVVVVQSRLGPLGYYRPPNASSEWSPPALMDLLLAMKWVRNNIAKFGGNASAVTLMGEGGGACGASMLALAAMQPKAGELHGLFKRVLLLGGVADTCISSARSSECKCLGAQKGRTGPNGVRVKRN